MSRSVKVPRVRGLSYARIGGMVNAFLGEHYPSLLRDPAPFPVAEFLEFEIERALGFRFGVQDMPNGIEAVVEPQDQTVLLSTETYGGLCDGLHRARFTAAHEIGHIVLHGKYLHARLVDGDPVQQFQRGEIAPYEDPEWQANAYGACLLMPVCHVVAIAREVDPIARLVNVFNVSPESASLMLKNLPKYLKR